MSLWQGVLWLGALIAFTLAATPLGRRRAARLPRPAPIRRTLRLTCLTVGFGLFLAVVCYSQSFDWALPLWERFPPLRAMQFPFRLLVPTAVGLALATGGALTLWLAPHRLILVAVSLAAIGLGIAGIGGRTIPLTPGLSRRVAPAPGGLYVSTTEFMPRTAHWTTWHEDEAAASGCTSACSPKLPGLAAALPSGTAIWLSSSCLAAPSGPALRFP